MHLQKMLNFMIAIFLIINIGLYFYNGYNDSVKYTLSSSRTDMLSEVVADNGVLLYSHYPKEYYPMPKLVIREPAHNEGQLVGTFFGESSVRIFSEEENRYSNGIAEQEETLIIKIKKNDQSGLVYYNNKEPELTISSIRNSIEMQEMVKPFVSTITLKQGEFELVDERMDKNEQDARLEYNERFEDALLFCNEVIIRISEVNGAYGITEATSIRYEPLYFTEEKYQIYPADEVLYKFLLYIEEEGLEDVRITKVEIGYLLGPDGLRDLKSDEIEPYYRIRTGDGQEFYINAYTNELLIF